MKSIYVRDDENKITPEERDILKALNSEYFKDYGKYDKLDTTGEDERFKSVKMFLQNPKKMRKYLRKHKTSKPKTKRCKCKK